MIHVSKKVTIKNPNDGGDLFWEGKCIYDASAKFYESIQFQLGIDGSTPFKSMHLYRDNKLLFKES